MRLKLNTISQDAEYLNKYLNVNEHHFVDSYDSVFFSNKMSFQMCDRFGTAFDVSILQPKESSHCGYSILQINSGNKSASVLIRADGKTQELFREIVLKKSTAGEVLKSAMQTSLETADLIYKKQRAGSSDRVDAKAKPLKAVFLMGGAGSGKSTIRSGIIDKHVDRNYLVIDPDLEKEKLESYQLGVQEKDKDIGTKCHDESVEKCIDLFYDNVGKRNFIYDFSGRDLSTYKDFIKDAKHQGMKVSVVYVETPVETCLERVQVRGEKQGRYVPERVVRDSNRGASQNFPILAQNPNVDKVKKYENGGTIPKRVPST